MKGKWIIAGALILIEIALCGAITTSMWSSIDAIGNINLSLGDFGSANVSATVDEEQTLETDGEVVLNVNKGDQEAFGDVTIISGTGNEVLISAHKEAWGVDEAAAQAALENVKVVVTQTGGTINVNMDGPDQIISLGRDVVRWGVDFTITVPNDTVVNAVTDFGDIAVSDTVGDVILNTNFGEISVENVSEASVDARTDFGDIRFEDLDAVNVTANSGAGEIHFTNVKASEEIIIETGFGGVEYEGGEADVLNVSTSSGGIELNDLTVLDDLIASTEFGTVTLNNVLADTYEVESSSGGITIAGATGKITAETSYGDVSVTDARDATIDLSTSSGAVEFAGTLGDGPHSLSSEFGNIHINLPEDVELSVDLKTEFGNISSDIPLTSTNNDDDDHWTGDLNGGGSVLTAETNSGQISIEIFNPQED